jgi:hypothetical protein
MPYKDTIMFPPQGKINTDADIKSVPKGDIIDAFCCRWGVKNDGTVGAVENIKGNELLAINLPEGNNTVIGGCQYYEDNSVLIFLYNDQNKHCILRIDVVTKEVTPILWEESILNFSRSFIQNPHVLDGVLYYLNTDGELKNLIIESAVKLTYEKYGEGIGWWIIEDSFIVQPN